MKSIYVPLLILFVALATVCSRPANAEDVELISAEGQREILGSPAAPSVGSTSPTVTIVEYFDYNCPYCKRIAATFRSLLASDASVAVVYKDWPILSATSTYAARCALAAKWQNKYVQAHDALMDGPRLSQNDQVDARLGQAGIDMARLKMDMERHAGSIDALLEHIDGEARALGLRGTPGVLVGRQLVSGAVDLPALQSLVTTARRQ